MAGRHGMQAFLAILLLGVFVTTEGAFFTKRTVLQSNCFAGEINTITVVLQSDTTLDRDTAISISGLRGAIVEDHDNVPLQGLNDELFSNGGCGTGFQSRAIWRETDDAGEPLHALVVWPLDPLNENTQYSFSFQVRNPEEEQMPTPGGTLDVTIESSGGVGIARVPVWTRTQLTADSLSLQDVDSCAPTSSATPIADVGGVDVALTHTARMPETFTFEVENCNGDERPLYANGVQSVTVGGAHCGCTGSSGRLQALDQNGQPDDRFSAHFQVRYDCVNSAGVAHSFDHEDMETCRTACQSITPVSVAREHVCVSRIDPLVTILDRGYGYSSPPMLRVHPDDEPGCDVEFTAHLAAGSGFVATYNVTTYRCPNPNGGFCEDVLPDECPPPGCQACIGVAEVTVTERGQGFDDSDPVELSRQRGGCALVSSTAFTKTPVRLDWQISGGQVMNPPDCDVASDSACFHEVPQATIGPNAWNGNGQCNGIFNVDTVTPKIFTDSAGVDLCPTASEYGDAYPMRIRGYNLIQKRIRQETTNPGALNTITVSLVAAFRLDQNAVIHLEGMDNAGLDNGDVPLTFDTHPNPGYSETATWICPSILEIRVSNTIAAGACAVFKFHAHNNRPSQEQSASQVMIKVADNGARNMDSQEMEMGDEGLTGTALAHSQPFHVLPAQFTEARVWQLLSYPREPSAEYKTSDNTLRIGGLGVNNPRENTLYFRFRTNFDIEVTTFFNISGLVGITTESSIREFESAGSSSKFASVFCSKRHAQDGANNLCGPPARPYERFKWDNVNENLKFMTFYPTERIPAGELIELHATVGMTQFDNPEIFISTTQHRASFDSDTVIFAGFEVQRTRMELGLDDSAACPSSMWNQRREETIPFSSRSPNFYIHTIHQATPFLAESNTITVTLALNVPLFPDSTITLRAPHAKWVNSGFTPTRGPDHSPEFLLTIEPAVELELKAQVSESAGRMVPGWRYTLQVSTIANPELDDFVANMATRTASQVSLDLDVPALGPLAMVKPDTSSLVELCKNEDDYHPFRYRNPAEFCFFYIEQTSSTPGAANNVTLSLATYYAFENAYFRLSSWPTSPTSITISPIFSSPAHTLTGRVSFIGPLSMTAGEMYNFTFSLTNWAYSVLNRDSTNTYRVDRAHEVFNLALLDGAVLADAAVRIANTRLDTEGQDIPFASACPTDRRPLRILAPGLCACTISSSSVVLPDRDNLLTVTFRSTVDVPSTAITSDTIYALTQTDSGSAWTASSGDPISSYVNYLVYDDTAKQMRFSNVTVNLAAEVETSFTYRIKAPLTAQDETPTFTLSIPDLGPAQTVTCDSSLVVLKPTFTLAKVGQVNPYPLGINNIIVTLQANYKPAGDWYIHIELINIENPNDIILDVDGNENTRGNVNIKVPSASCSVAGGICSTSGAGNISAFVDPEVDDNGVFVPSRGRFQLDSPNQKASLWFKITDMFEVETPYIFSFELRNPAKERASMTVSVTAERQYLLTPNQNPHIQRTEVHKGAGVFEDDCDGLEIFRPTPADAFPLFVRNPVLVASEICQSSEFPSTENTISVTITLNTAIPQGTTLTLSGFRGLFVAQEDTQDQIRDIMGDIDPASVGRRDVPGEGLEITFRVLDTARPSGSGARTITFEFVTDNPPSAQGYVSPAVSMNGVAQISLARSTLGECGLPDQNKRVLTVVQPRFTRSVINQKIPYPGAVNTLYLTIESNVPLVDNTQFLITGMVAQPTDGPVVTGLDFAEVEGDSLSATLVQTLCVKEQDAASISVKGINEQTNAEEVGSVTGIRKKCTDSNLICELQMQFGITDQNPAFTPIRFGIRVVNPSKIQDAPAIFMSTTEGTIIPRTRMLPDRTTCDDCTLASNSDALKIVNAEFRSASIIQTNPWPLGENYLILTFDSRVALEPGTVVTVSGFPQVDFKAGTALTYTSNSVAALRIDEAEVVGNADAQGRGCVDGDVEDGNGNAFSAKYPANCGKVEDDIIILHPGNNFDPPGIVLDPSFRQCPSDPAGSPPVDTVVDVTYTRDVFTVTRSIPAGELYFTVKDDTRTTRCSPLVIKIPVDNPDNTANVDVDTNGWSLPISMTIVANKGVGNRGVDVEQRAVDIDPDSLGPDDNFAYTICGRDTVCPSDRTLEAVVGDAVPFKLYQPEFVYWNMEQSMPYPDACNVITARFKTNVDIPTGTTVNMQFSMADTDVTTHPTAPSLGGYAADETVNTNTASKLDGAGCTLVNGFYECKVESEIADLVIGDYIRSYSGLVQETEFVPISSIFKVVSIDGLTLRLLVDDTIMASDVVLPQADNYFAKVVYIKPMVEGPGQVFNRAAYLEQTTSGAGWHQATVKLEATQTVLSGKEYAFQFTVRNAIPSADTAGVSRITITTEAVVNGETVTWTPKEAELDRTTVLLQEEARVGGMWPVKLARAVPDADAGADTLIDVSAEMPLVYFGPGTHVQIGDEVLMIVHHGNRSLHVRRGQVGTEPTIHAVDSDVRPVLPGSMPGDKVPFAVHSQRLVVNFGRQTNPLPGKFNRHQYTFAANFPLNKMHLLSMDPLLGATPAFEMGMIEPPCLRSAVIDRRCSSLEPISHFSNLDFFPDHMMPLYDAASSGSFNDMAMMLKLSAVSDRLRIDTSQMNVTRLEVCTNGTLNDGNCTMIVGNLAMIVGNLTNITLRETIYPDWQGTELTFPIFADNMTHCWDAGYTGTRPEPDFQAGDFLRINDEVIYVVEGCMLLRGVRGTSVANHSHNSVMYSIKEDGGGVFFGSCPAQGMGRNILPPGHLYQFTNAVLNPTSSGRDRQEAVPTKANLTFAPDGYETVASITYDNVSLPLGESGEFGENGDLQLMEVYGKTFIETEVGQSSTNPGHLLNRICVTLRPSFTIPEDSMQRTMFNLSGFTGGIHEGTTLNFYDSNSGFTASSFAGEVVSTQHPSGMWNQAESSITFVLRNTQDVHAGYQYQMCFDLKNPPDAQAAQTISLHSTGEVESVTIKTKNFTDCKCVEGWYKLGGVAGTGGGGSGFSAYVEVYDDGREPRIAFLGSGHPHPPLRPPPTRGSKYMATPDVEFTACSAIGTDDGATPANDCQCTCSAEDMFAVNVHGIAAVDGVHIECSEHVDWDDTADMVVAEGGMGSGFRAKFEATNRTGRVTDRLVIQHHGDAYLYTPYSENAADLGCRCDAEGTPSGGVSCRCNGPTMKLQGKYATLCNITVDKVVVQGSMIINSHQLKNAEGDHAPLVIHEPMWTTTVIAQGSPWPGAYNEMTITLQSNAAFEAGSMITITGFADASPDQRSSGGPPIYDNYPNDIDDDEFRPALTPSLRTVYTWVDGDPPTLTFSVKRRWEDDKQLVLHFRVNNPDLISPQQYPEFDFSTTATIEISRPEDATVTYIAQQNMISSNAPQGGIDGAEHPLKIYTDTWTQCAQNSARSIQFWEVGRSCHYPLAHSHIDSANNDITHAPDEICVAPAENGIVPVIGMTSVGQSECRPSMMNTITITLISNVPLGQKCALPCLEGAAITIIGIKGGDIEVIEEGATPELTAIMNSGADSDSAGEDSIFGATAQLPSDVEVLSETLDDPNIKAILVEVQNSEVVIPGRMHVFSFNVMNGPDEQLAADIPEFTMRVNGDGLLDGYSPLHNTGENDDYGAACYGAGTCKNVRLSPALLMHKDDSKESNLPMRIHGIPALDNFEIRFPGDLVAGNPVDVVIEFSMNNWVRMRPGRVLEVKLWRFEVAGALTVSDPFNLFGGVNFNSGSDILSLTVGTPPYGPEIVQDGADLGGATITVTVQGMQLPREGNIENNPEFNFASDPFSAVHGECLDGWIPSTQPPDSVTVATSGPPVGWLQTTSLDWMTLVPAGEPNAGEENRIAGREAKIVTTFRLWMDLTPSDSIVFTLPGFTGADSSGDTEGGEWTYSWSEGDEELTLQPKAAVDVPAIEMGEADRDFTVTVPQSAGIVVPDSGVPVVQDPPFMVRSDAAAGPVLPIAVDAHEPVYRYRCQISTVTASSTNQGYCDGTWAIQMCAMNAASLQTYITTNSLRGEDGYVAASGQEVIIGGETVRSGTPLSTCGSEIDAQCKAIGGTPELQSVTFFSYPGDNQKKNLCCKHSNEVATVGLGNLATCLTDDDCINIEAGRTSLDPAGTSVATFDSEFHICCDWCYEYYGVVACGASDFSPRGEDDADIRSFCEVEQQCRSTPPCYGHYLEATANPPDPTRDVDTDLQVVTLKGDGVTIKNGDLPDDLRAPISVYEVKTEQLSSKARGQIGGENGLRLAGSILEFGPSGTRFNNPIPIEIQVEPVEGASWELGPPPRTTVPASGTECCDCQRNGCVNAEGTCAQPGANSNPNCGSFDCNDYCSGEIAGGNVPAPAPTEPAPADPAPTTAAAAAATTTPTPARRLLDWTMTGDLRHLLQDTPVETPTGAPPKGDGEDYLIFKLVDETWKVVAPTQLKSVRNDVATQVWKARAMITSFSVYAPFFASYPEVPPVSKYWTTAGDEVYLTIAAAVFLMLLMWLIIILPCFRREKPLPLAPVPPPPPPPPVPFVPPPPPAAPVFITDVAPHTRYNTEGAPIKHFGPDMPGAQFDPGLEDGHVEDEFLHGAGPEATDGMLGYPYSDPYHLEEGVSYMPPAPMYGPPLGDFGPMGASVAPQGFSAAPAYPYGQSAVPQYSVGPQYPGQPYKS